MPTTPDPAKKSAAQKKWADKHRGELADYQKTRRKAGDEPKRGPDPMKTAHKAITKARETGALKPPSRCPNCGKSAPLAFHHQGGRGGFLCASCHRKAHA